MSTRLVRKLAGLKPAEWRDLLEAQAALLSARWLVRTRPTGRLVDDATTTHTDGSPVASERTRALALAVERAAEHGLFRPQCLVRAVALNRLLESHGIRGSRIRVGVRVGEQGFAAHAWVELGEQVLGDRADRVRGFVELADVRVADP